MKYFVCVCGQLGRVNMIAQKGASTLCLEVLGYTKYDSTHSISQETEWCLVSSGTFSRDFLYGTSNFGLQIA